MIDKLQTQRYDSEGGEWCLQPRGRPALINVGPSPLSSISEVDAQPDRDIILLYDSMCKHGYMSQLVAGTNMKGTEIRCSNISVADPGFLKRGFRCRNGGFVCLTSHKIS